MELQDNAGERSPEEKGEVKSVFCSKTPEGPTEFEKQAREAARAAHSVVSGMCPSRVGRLAAQISGSRGGGNTYSDTFGLLLEKCFKSKMMLS